MLLNIIVWLIVGAILGWLASMLVGGRQGLLLNTVVGIVGAFVAGLLLTPIFKIPTIDQGSFSFPSLMISLLGAVILLAVVNLFRRGMYR